MPPPLATACRLLAAIVLAAVLLVPAAARPAPLPAVLDLTGWDVAADPLWRLGDGWTFYWGDLVDPAELGAGARPGGRAARIPAPWNMRELDGTGSIGSGVATYHLRLMLPAGAPALAIRLPATYSASVLWADGVKLIANGEPAADIAGERRVVQDRIAPLPAGAAGPDGRRSLDLVLHVSNHILLGSGPTRAPVIGTADALLQDRVRQVAFDLFVVGACLMAGLFFLVLFATRPRERGFAWFGGFCISVALGYAHLCDVLVTLAPDLLDRVPNPLMIVMALVTSAGIGLFLLVIAAMYPREVSARIAAGIGALALLYPVSMIAGRNLGIDTVTDQWSLIRSLMHLLVLAGLGYGVAGVALAAYRRRPGAAVALAGTLAFVAAILHDLAQLRAGAPTSALQGLGLLVFVLAYAAVLGGRLNAAFAAAESASAGLRQLNLTLEQKVSDRTADLERAARRAEDADRAKSQFLAAANHDLRQPLHAMALVVGVLDNRVRDPALREQIEALKACLAGTEGLLGGILDIAKLDAGAVRPRLEPCDLGGVFRRAAAELAPFARERAVRLRVAGTRQHVLADAPMLGRILANLAGNAIKYAPGGRVLIGARRRGDRIRIEVRDDGIGIPEAEQERIFAEFQQASPAPGTEKEGLGLGLAITRRFARLLGGEVALRSAPGRGSCFWLELPRVAAPLVAAPAPVRRPSTAGTGLEGLRVMVVDDDPRVLQAIAPLLSDWGCMPMTALNAGAAVALLRAAPGLPDVLIVDSHIGPDDRGHRVIAELQALAGDDLPAAIVTGDTTPDRLKALAGLGFPVLHKPIQPGKLASLIRHLTRGRRPGAAAEDTDHANPREFA